MPNNFSDPMNEYPTLCRDCFKLNTVKSHRFCKFCADTSLPETILCELTRDNQQDKMEFQCYAFQPMLRDVKAVPPEQLKPETQHQKSIRGIIQSDRSKYKNAPALQKLNRNPDAVILDLQYHVIWTIVNRQPLFKSDEDIEKGQDIFRKFAEENGGICRLILMAPDHVHLLLDSDGKRPIDTDIKRFNKHVNNVMQHTFDEISNKAWGHAYFVETVG